jgi:hypothetical protein
MGKYAFVQCKKCVDINYLTSEALGNLTNFKNSKAVESDDYRTVRYGNKEFVNH